MKNKKRSEQEIKTARLNVKYELKMLNASVEAKLNHLSLAKEEKNKFIGSIYLDSILLHFRNLYDFFCSKNYVMAKYFLQNKSWMPTKFKLYNKKLIDEINVYRSHITYARKMGEEKPKWEIETIRNEIIKVYKEFLDQLNPDERDKWKISKNKLK